MVESFRLLIFTYFSIGIYLYLAIGFGRLNLEIKSKQTGEYLEKGTRRYEILKFLFCMGWIGLLIQSVKRGDDDGDD